MRTGRQRDRKVTLTGGLAGKASSSRQTYSPSNSTEQHEYKYETDDGQDDCNDDEGFLQFRFIVSTLGLIHGLSKKIQQETVNRKGYSRKR